MVLNGTSSSVHASNGVDAFYVALWSTHKNLQINNDEDSKNGVISPSRSLLAAPCLAAVRLAARPPGRRPSSRRPPGRISHFNVVFCMVCVRLVLYNDIQRMHCPAKYNFCSYAYVRWIMQRSLSGRITHQRAMPGTV